MSRSIGFHGVSISIGATLLACASTREASPELVQIEEQRLRSPFDDEQIIVATECELSMTANFYPQLAQGVNAAVHQTSMSTDDDGATVYRFTTSVPGASPMMFSLGKTRLVVEQSMVLRVLGGRNAMTLDVSARSVTLRRDGRTQQLPELRIRDGLLRQPD